MKIRTCGVPENYKKFTRVAVNFFTDNVMKKRSVDRIEFLQITIVEPAVFNGPEEADCEVVGTDSYGKPDAFLIRINRNVLTGTFDPMRYTAILFHELTHMWQFATKRLQTNAVGGYNMAKFNGKKYNTTKMEYWLSPWEIEAHGYEVCLNGLFYSLMENGVNEMLEKQAINDNKNQLQRGNG